MASSEVERGPRGVWRIALLVAGLLLLGEQVVFGGPIVHLDHAVQTWVRRDSFPVVGPIAQLVADLASPPFVLFLMLLLVAVAAVWRRSWQPLVAGVTCAIALAVAVLSLKYAVGRPGPTGQGSLLAWPSGHTTTAVVASGVIARLLSVERRRLATMVAIAPPLMVGIALVLRNYHWTSDVLAGWLLGPLVLTVGYAVTRWLLGRGHYPQAETPMTGDPLLSLANSDK